MKQIVIFISFSFLSTCLFAQWAEQNCEIATADRGFEQIIPVSGAVAWATVFDVTGTQKSIRDFTRTEDGGTTWIPGSIAIAPTAYGWACLSAISSDTAWAALKDDSTGVGGAVYRTYDGGTTWTKLNIFSSVSVPRIVYFFSGYQGIAIGDPVGGIFEIYATDDGGDTWDSVAADKIPTPQLGEKPVKASFESRGNKFYFGSSTGRLFVTQDKGHNWDANNIPDFDGSVDKVISTDNKNFILRQHEEGSTDYKFTRTDDGGITWNDLTTEGPFYEQNLCKVPNTDNTLVSCGWDQNLAVGSSFSNNFGSSWYALDTAVRHTGLGFFDNAHGWSGGVTADSASGGIYNFTGYFYGVGIQQINNAYRSFSIQPNPVKDQFVLQLNSYMDASEIKVSDVSGRLIYSREIDHALASDLIIDASDWNEGLYVVQLKTGTKSETQKLIVSR